VKHPIAIALIVTFTAGMLLGWEIGVASRSVETDSSLLMPIVVAIKDIPAGTRLDEPQKWLTKRMFLKESAPLDAFSRLGDLRGQLVRERVRAWEPCTARYLAHAVPISVPAPGSRAVTVAVRDLPPPSVPTLPGGRADVVYSGPDRETGEVGAVLLVENVLVLAVNRIEPAGTAAKHQVRHSVTVALAAEDADRLLWAADHGSLTLLPRVPNN
jgi:Flp pilus assembly protein CpaB